MIKLRRRLSFANITAVLALLLALSGGAYALSLPKNSVGAKQLKKNAVTANKIKKNAVTTAKIKKNAVTAPKLADGLLLFAYVAFNSPSDYALGYGRGAVEVTNQNAGRIDVRFNRSVHGCATHVTPGNVAPHDDDLDFLTIPSVHVDPDETPGLEDDVVRVLLRRSDNSSTDTSFLITLFC